MARYQERLANAYGRLGEVEQLRNSLRAAQRAVELYEKLEQDDDLARASLGLGRLQLTLVGFGEEQELLPAFEQLRRALGLFRKLNDRQGRAECLMGLTQIYLHGDNERQEADMRQAFDCLAEALAIYRLLGDDEAVAFAQRMMDNFDRAGDRVE
jgi:tetratricopeptide (TPR) repeat protein